MGEETGVERLQVSSSYLFVFLRNEPDLIWKCSWISPMIFSKFLINSAHSPDYGRPTHDMTIYSMNFVRSHNILLSEINKRFWKMQWVLNMSSRRISIIFEWVMILKFRIKMSMIALTKNDDMSAFATLKITNGNNFSREIQRRNHDEALMGALTLQPRLTMSNLRVS